MHAALEIRFAEGMSATHLGGLETEVGDVQVLKLEVGDMLRCKSSKSTVCGCVCRKAKRSRSINGTRILALQAGFRIEVAKKR